MVIVKSADQSSSIPALIHNVLFDETCEQNFESITSLVCSVLQVSTCAVTLNDGSLQWLEWSEGLGKSEDLAKSISRRHFTERKRLSPIENEKDGSRFLGDPCIVGSTYARKYAAVPLVARDGVIIGMLCVLDNKPLSFDAAEWAILDNFAGLIVEELDLRTQEQHDFLTGALTRRAFSTACTRAVRQHRRDETPSALLIFDLDNFKQINDAHGHVMGDKVLRAVGNVCAASLRPQDVFGRLGGEEFGIVLPATDFSAAIVCVERVRSVIEQLVISCGRVTASFGLAMVEDQREFNEWFAAADGALYAAKRRGRNCWVAELSEPRTAPAVAVNSKPRASLAKLIGGLRTARMGLSPPRSYRRNATSHLAH